MATTLSRNLKLRIDSGLTANAKYNLNRIDLIGLNVVTDNTDTLQLRSRGDVVIEPNSSDVEGTGVGGSVSIGTDSHVLSSVNIHAAAINLSSPLGFLDSGVGGSKYLRIKYDSTVSGSVDTLADRTLSIDLNGADRSLVLGANLTVLGSSLTLNMPASLSLTMPIDYGTPGQVLTSVDGAGTLGWTDAGSGDVSGYATNWTNADTATKVVTHGLGSTDVDVTIVDDSNDIIFIDNIDVTSSNTLTLTSSEAPATSWRVVVQAK